MTRWCLVILVFVAACGRRSAGDGKAICERAGAKYASCIGEILGPEARALAESNDGTAACARDDKTVAMYRACLPETDCEAFMDCLEAYVRATDTPIAADRPRPEQCEQHVADGLRAIAYQELSTGVASRTDGDVRRAQECVMDESRRWEDCLEASEIAQVHRYGAQRQRECEAWSPELAACILELPGAKDCDPDSHPFWRLPLDEGPAGPPVAWSIDVRDDDDLDRVDVAWVAARTLIVLDADGLRAVRDGAPRWTQPAGELEGTLAIAGGWIAVDAGDDRGLALFEIATGTRAAALAGTYVDTIGAAGDRFVVLAGGGELHEVTPARCARGGCARKLGELDDGALPYVSELRGRSDGIVMASTVGIHVTDRRGATRFTIALDADQVLLTPEGAVVADSQGVAVLSLDDCAALGRELELESTQEGLDACVAARAPGGWIETASGLPGRAVAFNVESVTETTRHVGPGGSWEARTGAVGGVAGDDRHVYAVMLGLDRAGPVRLLALARTTGAVVWQTELAATPPDQPAIRLVTAGGLVAARVGDKLHVIDAARHP